MASRKFLAARVAACLVFLLAACGGGGGGTPQANADSGSAIPRIEPLDTLTAARSLAMAAPAAPAAAPVHVPAATVSLGSLSAQEVQRMAALRDQPASTGKARPIGFSRALADTADAAAFERRLAWQPLPGGGMAAALSVRSDGAAALRLGLRVQRLPAGAVLRVQGSTGAELDVTGQTVLDLLALNARAGDRSGRYWLPPVAGDQATLQIELPAGTDPAQLALALPELSHLWTQPTARDATLRLTAPSAGGSGACEVDATCSPEFDAQARSVALLVYSDTTTTFLCTGTLVADVAGTATPWMLTAKHCIDTQSKASSLTTYWFYHSTSCNSGVAAASTQTRTGGAQLKYLDATTDASFLQLQQAPPAGVLYAGSLVGPIATGTDLADLHHPEGDLLKLSQGTLATYADCSVTGGRTTCNPVSDTSGSYLALGWRSGITEPGSSGSAAFTTVGTKRYVVGHLFAGSTSCSQPGQSDYYGRFDLVYPNLRTWLGTVPGT